MDQEVNAKLAAKKIQELLPYEMTPFYDSEMEEDNNKNQRIKAIPMWARYESTSTFEIFTVFHHV